MFKDNKFNGDLSQDIMETMKLYAICSCQHRLSLSQKADFYVHVFEGSARKFFFENIEETMSYNEMAQVMLKEYVGDARQMHVKGTLETLPLRSFMKEKEIDDISEGLTKLAENINELSPQCPPDFRFDAHKIDYLRKAVTEFQDWSRIPIQNINSQSYSFNTFVTTLHESVQNLRQMQLLSGGEAKLSLPGIVDNPFDMNMMQYGRNPRFGKHRKWNSPKGNRFGGHSEKNVSFVDTRRCSNECYRCGAPEWNPKHGCEKGAIALYAKNRLKKGESSVLIVADLVQEMEGDLDGSDESQEGDTGTMFGRSSGSEVVECDALYANGDEEEEPNETGFTESDLIKIADKEIYISQLAAAMGEKQNEHAGFRTGDAGQ